ncbi:MAG: hypothetical protein HYW86_02810 [Candidatus Roizmanbacteria bacterium]|nr:MAG: hypothetical protein HYW86_02810 [Candidatus Roizmanbacteria bacterium]
MLGISQIYLFVSGIKISDNINMYESNIKKLKQDNMELENKLSKIESLGYAASQAAVLKYTKKAAPIYLDKPGIAKL